MAEYLVRARNDFAQDEVAPKSLERQVSCIRQSGADAGVLGATGDSSGKVGHEFYTLQEVGQAIATLRPGKQATRGCLAAVRAACEARRRLSGALMNLGRHVGLTTTHWSIRVVSPLRKSGPKVVRRVACLRPVSIATEMASLQDALWLARNSAALVAHCEKRSLVLVKLSCWCSHS